MTTPPIGPTLAAAIRGATAWQFSGQIGEELFTPRFFCCTDPNELGISPGKDPVAVISLSPNPALVGDTVSFDGSDSYDPDGSIASYAWALEGQVPPTSSSASGTFTATATGVYTIELKVTDGTGLVSQPARVELIVVENDGLKKFFIGSEMGVFYTGDGATWIELNDAISNYQLITYDVKVDPATITADRINQTVWRAGFGAVYSSVDGGNTWDDQTPSFIPNVWYDSPGPSAYDIQFTQLMFTSSKLFLIGRWQDPAGDWRSWLWYTNQASDYRSGLVTQVIWNSVDTTWEDGS